MKRMFLGFSIILMISFFIGCPNPSTEDPPLDRFNPGSEVAISPTTLAGFTVGETRVEIEAKLGDRVSRFDPEGPGGVYDRYDTEPTLVVYYEADVSKGITIYVTSDVDVVSDEFRVNATTTYTEITSLYSDLIFSGSQSDRKIIATNDDYHFEFYGVSGGPHYLGELEIDG